MWQTLISGLLPLLGVLLGGFAAHRFTVRRERETRENARRANAAALRREKGEELYALVSEWSEFLMLNCMPFIRFMEGKLSVDEAVDQQTKRLSEVKSDFGSITMLIKVYFPASEEDYKSCLAELIELREIESSLVRDACRGKEPDSSLILKYMLVRNEFIKESGKLKRSIRDELRKYVEE
jgi:hypothetical protein